MDITVNGEKNNFLVYGITSSYYIMHFVHVVSLVSTRGRHTVK